MIELSILAEMGRLELLCLRSKVCASFMQACYGHTEGAAGMTGLLLAMQSVSQHSAAGIMCLRSMNPYVSAAVADWTKRAGHAPLLPRQLGSACQASLAGVSL